VRVRRKGLFYVPGWLYDAALGTALRGLRRRVAAAVAAGSLFPCLDVCCGTGSQLRASERLFRADGNGNDNGGARGRGLVIGLDSHFGMIRYASARAGVWRPAWVPERTGSDGTGATAVGTLPATSAPLPAGSGSIFVVGDALRLPFKDASFRGVTISFGLHDKSSEDRMAIAREARRILAPGGKAILVDFENPWNARSRLGALLVHAIERTAGGAHYRNGRLFLARGGLRAFLREAGFAEESRRDIETGSIAVVTCGVRN
jgi:ubiquinone/menaquinone biosynthesis C-methylase UbiE